jgi:hypothetical protein
LIWSEKKLRRFATVQTLFTTGGGGEEHRMLAETFITSVFGAVLSTHIQAVQIHDRLSIRNIRSSNDRDPESIVEL